MGGYRLNYPYDAGSPTANLIETKVILNSTISDARHGARFMSDDIKDYFLATTMVRAAFMKVHSRHIPEDIMRKYELHNKFTSDGYVYIHIKKGMYGVKQAAILPYEHLNAALDPHVYTPITSTVCLWKNNTRPKTF